MTLFIQVLVLTLLHVDAAIDIIGTINKNMTMSVDVNSTFYQYCQDSVFAHYYHWFLIPAVAVIALLSFLEKRKSVKPSLLGGRPALVSPFGFLDEPRNRWGMMFVFGSVTGNIISVALRVLSSTVEFPVWAKIFLVYILCLEMSVISYPLFACMTSRHKCIGGITGLLYASGWFGYKLFETVQATPCYTQYTTDAAAKLHTKEYFIAQRVPLLICDVLVVLKFSWKIYKYFKKGIRTDNDQDQYKLCRSYHLTYVKYLLKRNTPQQCDGKRLPLMEKLQNTIMRPVPGFRFPISIIITVFMSAMMLYSISLALLNAMGVISVYLKSVADIPDLLQAANVVATILTILCGIRNIYIFVINYRTDMLSLYKGDRSFIPETVHRSSPNVYMAQGMRFIGTSITGMLWGSLVCYLIVYIPLATMMILVKSVILSGKIKYLWNEFEWLVYPVCMIIIFKMQTFFIGRFFMQPKIHEYDKQRPLAVDNRNAYNTFSFFMVFLNASIGVFSFLKRILVSALLGVFLIPRMDRCLLMRGYEAMDKCYVNYIGMIMVDVAHNHPVLRTFCFLLKSEITDWTKKKPLHSGENAVDTFARNSATSSTNNRRMRRWWLAYTLIRNPSLTAMRVHEAKKNTLVDLNDIKCSSIESTKVKDQPGDTWDCSCRPVCCKEYKCRIPPNLLTNIFAVIVFLCIIIIYASVSLLNIV